MSKHLFLGGSWDGRVQHVDSLSHIVVPTVDSDWVAGEVVFSQQVYSGHRYLARWPHPCVRQVDVAECWQLYVHGPLPDDDTVQRALWRHRPPLWRWEWKPVAANGQPPWWAWEIQP